MADRCLLSRLREIIRLLHNLEAEIEILDDEYDALRLVDKIIVQTEDLALAVEDTPDESRLGPEGGAQ